MEQEINPSQNPNPVNPQLPHKNLHPGIWIAVLILAAFSVAYLVWANASKEWPFEETLQISNQKTDQMDDRIAESNNSQAITSVVEVPLNWKTYSNNEIGIRFMYPPEFGNLETRTVVPADQAGVLAGKKIEVFQKDEPHFVLLAVTTDYQGFAERYIAGSETLESNCKEPMKFTESAYVCKLEKINNNTFLIENQERALECSYFGFFTHASIKNSQNQYTGLTFSISIPDVSQKLSRLFDCWDESKVAAQKAAARQESENVISKSNLSSKDKQTVENFYKILSSLEFTN